MVATYKGSNATLAYFTTSVSYKVGLESYAPRSKDRVAGQHKVGRYNAVYALPTERELADCAKELEELFSGSEMVSEKRGL